MKAACSLAPRFALLRGEERPLWAKYLRLDDLAAFKQSLRYLQGPRDSDSRSLPQRRRLPAQAGTADRGGRDRRRHRSNMQVLRSVVVNVGGGYGTACQFRCGADEICPKCRASIEENDDDLLADWQAREARKELGRKIWAGAV